MELSYVLLGLFFIIGYISGAYLYNSHLIHKIKKLKSNEVIQENVIQVNKKVNLKRRNLENENYLWLNVKVMYNNKLTWLAFTEREFERISYRASRNLEDIDEKVG